MKDKSFNLPFCGFACLNDRHTVIPYQPQFRRKDAVAAVVTAAKAMIIKMSLVLGIDTSNYTTSAALVSNGEVVKNIKLPLPVRDGEVGLRQSDAVFHHVKNLPLVMEQIGKADICAVGWSAYPRDGEGSYMPCFLAGEATARAVAAMHGIPAYAFSHQAGHIRAAVYSAGAPELYEKPFCAFHVSGGTSDILLVRDGKIAKIGGTLDLNAGQAIDRAGVALGFRFPCGAELEAAAGEYNGNVSVSVHGTECNLSGLENLTVKMINNGAPVSLVAAFVLKFIEVTLVRLAENVVSECGSLPLLFCGGVMSNRRLRHTLTEKFGAYFGEAEYSGDNAAGTALLAWERLSEDR